MKRVAVIILCFVAVNLLAQPNERAPKHKEDSTDHASNTITFEDNRKTEKGTDTAKASSPQWYTSSEWWLVIIAGLTGIAIAIQAREMKRATNVMQGQMTEMQKSREIESKTLILQYRPKIVVRHVRAVQFSFELGEPGECEIRFVMVNKGGSPAHIAAGGTIRLMSCIGYDPGKIEFKEGDSIPISQFTLQPGEQVTIEETLPTGAINDLDWANYREGLAVKPLRYIFLLGTIYYADDLNIPRATGLYRKYDPKSSIFVPDADSEQEYTD